MNVLLPWVALQGLAVGTADGRWVRADPPPPVDDDEALATLGRRYLEGYGPAGDRDLAAWSGLPLGRARRALELAGPVAPAAPAEPPACALLAAFDTAMLGWASREPLVPPAHARAVLPGGGMLRPVVLAGERVVGTWRGDGGEIAWFGPRPPAGRAGSGGGRRQALPGAPEQRRAGYTAAPMDSLSRRALVSVLAVAAIAVPVAGCGGGDSGDSGKNPLDNALGYVPKDTPFVAAIETDPNSAQFKNAAAIVQKFPFAGQLERQLEQGLGSGGADYQRDIKPLLGNEFVVGATNVETFTDSGSGDNEDFIAAIQVKDKEKLTAAIEREKPKELGEKDGAKLYQDDDSFAAVDDDVLVVANSRRELEAGLERRGSDDRFSEDDFDKGTEGLPEDSVVRTYFDLQRLLAADPDTADARKVKWVSALRTFGLSASVNSDRVDLDFTMRTDSGDLSDADLPLAAGDQSPEVVERPGQIGLGLRGLDQIVKFGESAAQAVDPAQFGSYETAKRTIERQLDLELQKDVLDQLGGDISAGVSPAGSSGGLVAEVKDPDQFKSTLAKVSRVLPRLASGAAVRKSGDLYSVRSSDGNIAYGMVGEKFVLSQTAAGARAAASAPTGSSTGPRARSPCRPTPASWSARALSGLGGSGQLGGLLGAQVFAGPLGDLTGSVEVQHRRHQRQGLADVRVVGPSPLPRP